MSKLKYLSGATTVLKWCVLYPIDASNSAFKKLLHACWSAIYVSSLVVTMLQCHIQLAVKPFDFVKDNGLIMHTVIYTLIVTIFFIFNANSKRFVRFVHDINANFADETDNGIETIKMDVSAKFLDKLAIFWCVSLIANAVVESSFHLMFANHTLPIPGWFPYDATRSPTYELSCAWQFVSQFIVGSMYGSSDIIYPCLTLTLAEQFKLLSSNFKNTLFCAVLKCGVPRDVVLEFKEDLKTVNLSDLVARYKDVFRVLKHGSFHQINSSYFIKNIRHHLYLLRCCDELNQIFSLYMLTKVVAAIFNVVFIMFCLMIADDKKTVSGLLPYIYGGVSELFMYTYSGQILTQSAELLDSLYENPWYLCDKRFGKLFAIVQMSQSHFTFSKAGNYFKMTAPMFITCLKSVYSYLALLNQMIRTT